jgi:hypothetical protein
MQVKIHVRMNRETLWLLESKERLGKVCVLSRTVLLTVLLLIYLFIACWMATSVAELMQSWMVGWLMTWKECGRNLSCSDLRYYPALACCSVSSRFRQIQPFLSTVQQVLPCDQMVLCAVSTLSVKYIKQQIWTHFREIHKPFKFFI